MPDTMHCCDCGREWVPGAYGAPHVNVCPLCQGRNCVPVADCVECQADAVRRGVPRERWLCKPHEEEKE